jgi:hypothetical protein
MKKQKDNKKGRAICRILQKYAEKKKENFTAIKEGMELYEDYLKKSGIKNNKEKIISTESYNVFNRC